MSETPDGLNEDALVVFSDRGRVVLQGPGNVSIVLTPDAAERTGRFMDAAAKRARY